MGSSCSSSKNQNNGKSNKNPIVPLNNKLPENQNDPKQPENPEKPQINNQNVDQTNNPKKEDSICIEINNQDLTPNNEDQNLSKSKAAPKGNDINTEKLIEDESQKQNVVIQNSTYHYLEIYKDNILKINRNLEDTLTLLQILTSEEIITDSDPIQNYKVICNEEEISIYIENKIGLIFKNISPDIAIKIFLEPIHIEILELPENIKKAYVDSCKIIGSISLDDPESLRIVTYDTQKDSNQISKYIFPYDNDIQRGAPFSAYCNGLNTIYLSGGEAQGEMESENNVEFYNDFYEIDLSKLDECNEVVPKKSLPPLNVPRSFHSMIYVPHNYIFIVGGQNTKTVELYKISENQIDIDSELIEQRCEPTLCLMNDKHLYTFCGFLIYHNFCNTIERCDLQCKNRVWENVNYNLPEGIELMASFFGCTYYQDGILLLGGNENDGVNNKNYLFNKGKNGFDINEFDTTGESNVIYKEKFFIPCKDNISINIPMAIKKIEVLLFNQDKGCIENNNYYNDEESSYIQSMNQSQNFTQIRFSKSDSGNTNLDQNNVFVNIDTLNGNSERGNFDEGKKETNENINKNDDVKN